MRLAILTAGLSLSLCAGPLALCQSSQPDFANPAQPSASQPSFQFPGKDFSKTAPLWQNSNVPTSHVLVLPHTELPRPTAKAQIDPQMIIHPSKSRIGAQPPGSLIAQNVYPGLRLMPISATATGKPIPTDWPKFKLESIPIAWPNLEVLPVDSNSSAAKPSPTK
jgi:hypothetical protein